MACVENVGQALREDSEMEEGEIVDDLDDLSDISSGEELLLRQRMEVLETYNSVLGKKKNWKLNSVVTGRNNWGDLQNDLSEISDVDDPIIHRKDEKSSKYNGQYLQHRYKRARDVDSHHRFLKSKQHKKKPNKIKKKPQLIISETSEESDDEYRNKRRKLADAVAVNRGNCDKSSLSERLKNMLCGFKEALPAHKVVYSCDAQKIESVDILDSGLPKNDQVNDKPNTNENSANAPMDLGFDNSIDNINELKEQHQNSIDSQVTESTKEEICHTPDHDSDDDIELLRQLALQTKSLKPKSSQSIDPQPVDKGLPNHEDVDEDDYTEELRRFCLKSSFFKSMKRKHKLIKKMVISSKIEKDLKMIDYNEFDLESNFTDIESVDMDIGSDNDEKSKDLTPGSDNENETSKKEPKSSGTEKNKMFSRDDFEEDEDLLRAKLLTSLSKNLPNLVDPVIADKLTEMKTPEKSVPVKDKTDISKIPDEKRIIINLQESDSEGEHEATKNLTKMHLKLSEQVDFQHKLDMFLKSTRMEVEKEKLPDVVQPNTPKTPKFVVKAVKNLPISEQIEYKNLVKRMSELEKLKQARQAAMSITNKQPPIIKDTLKPRNIPKETNNIVVKKLEEQITMSRKNIAEESSKMLQLKEEATKLSQKYKIVATELRNITTAITLNKKNQRVVQNKLSKIRNQHQILLKRSSRIQPTVTDYFAPNNSWNNNKPNLLPTTKLQKENNPSKNSLKSVKVSVVNDLKEDNHSNLSVQIDVNSNKKTVVMPKGQDRLIVIDKTEDSNTCESAPDSDLTERLTCQPVEEKGDGDREDIDGSGATGVNEYKSPLEAFGAVSWEGDPHAFLCPFEVGGHCKDTDCKHLHPKNQKQ